MFRKSIANLFENIPTVEWEIFSKYVLYFFFETSLITFRDTYIIFKSTLR